MSSSTRKSLPLYTVDAFARTSFTGNPAAVCLIEKEDVSDEVKQKIAMEMNISETAFVRPLKAGDCFKDSSLFELRWFTPTNEVNLCGHATLATAATIFQCKGNKSDALTFRTKSGDLIARRSGELTTIDLPLNPPKEKVPEGVDKLIKIVLNSVPPADVRYTSGANKEFLLRVPDSLSREEFEKISPDVSAMMGAHSTGEIMGVILTLRGSKDNGAVDEEGRVYDFISRYFAPWNGINEDPVTGAAHTVLSAYWSEVLGKKKMYARQCSSRGGDLEIMVRDDGRVELSGNAKVVLEGTIFID